MPGNFHEVPEWILEQWPKPNYVDPVRRTWMAPFALVFPAISTFLIAGRFWLRATKQSGDFGLDDMFIGIGWAVSVGFSALAVIDADWYDLDRHTWDVKPTHYTGAALCGWIAQVLFLVSTCATKTAVLLFYRRMVAGTYSRVWVYTIWAALAFLGGYFISILLVYCFLCRPLTAYWESYDFTYDKEFTCINGNVLNPFIGALSVFTDVYAVVIPCVMLAQVELDVPRRQKIGLNIIFALGLVVAGFGIARTYYLWQINNNYDTSWTGFTLYMWSLLECHFAVIFACAPALRAFVRRYMGESIRRTFGSSKGRSHPRSDGKGYTPDSQWRDGSVGRTPSLPLDTVDKQFKSQEELEPRPSDDYAENRGNFYHEGDTSATTTPANERNGPIRNADEYEAYAMRQLNRYALNKTLPLPPGEGTGQDWDDPRRRYDSDNAV